MDGFPRVLSVNNNGNWSNGGKTCDRDQIDMLFCKTFINAYIISRTLINGKGSLSV